MTTTPFNRYATEGNQILVQLAGGLEMSHNYKGVYRILETVLCSIRNHITLEESFQFLSQLPMALKSVYVTNWRLNKKPKHISSMKDFVNEVFELGGGLKTGLFREKSQVERIIHIVFDVLNKFIPDKKFKNILNCMPPPLRVHLLNYVLEGHRFIV